MATENKEQPKQSTDPIVELKARAYDILAHQEHLGDQLRAINQKITQLSQQPKPQTKKETNADPNNAQTT